MCKGVIKQDLIDTVLEKTGGKSRKRSKKNNKSKKHRHAK
jgi:hypothetical protein